MHHPQNGPSFSKKPEAKNPQMTVKSAAQKEAELGEMKRKEERERVSPRFE
jgi:hypothetical protein